MMGQALMGIMGSDDLARRFNGAGNVDIEGCAITHLTHYTGNVPAR